MIQKVLACRTGVTMFQPQFKWTVKKRLNTDYERETLEKHLFLLKTWLQITGRALARVVCLKCLCSGTQELGIWKWLHVQHLL